MYWLFRFFAWWPLAALQWLGGLLGWMVWAASPRYRQQFRANVAQAGLPFPVARPAIGEAGRFVAELPKLWLRPRGQSCLGDVTLDGQEHAKAAFAPGRGVIFFSAHGGCFEIEPQALAELYGPITAIYRPARKPWLARLQAIARDRPGLHVVPAGMGGIRLMLKALKAGQAVALLTDQVPPEGQGVWAPYFGKPAYTMTLAARLALQSGAVMLPVTCERLKRGRGYALKIWPALTGLEAAGKSDMLHAVTVINQAIEAIVRSQPHQYLWGYARYKTPRKEPA
ncbi:MAG: lipid biosynthesis acyltransferase [Polaromonas sp.]|nr:lipid biosynthesis acyltransferase [Polaromonas sp.]